LKSAWLHENDLSYGKKNVVDFMLKTREQLRTAVDDANESAAQRHTNGKTSSTIESINGIQSIIYIYFKQN